MSALNLHFKRCCALVTSSIVAGAGLSGPVIMLDSGESYTASALKLFDKWIPLSPTEEKESQAIKPSGENVKSSLISELVLKPEYMAPKYPVVLCHGLSGFDKLMILPSLNYLLGLSRHTGSRRDYIIANEKGISVEYWFGIKEALEQRGARVMVAKVPGFGRIEERAGKLNSFIEQEVELMRNESKDAVYNEDNRSDRSFKEKGEKMKVNLVAHSMGGLDARYLIAKLEKQNYQVVSLTTVATPHRGSEMADYVVDACQGIKEHIKLPPSFRQLTTDYLRQFNHDVTDDPKVQYFSYGAQFTPSWYNVFYGSWAVINRAAGANDGMVSVESAKWGTYLGTLVNVDHLDLINWTNSFKKVMSSVAPGLEGPKIDTVALYLNIADNLAKRGL